MSKPIKMELTSIEVFEQASDFIKTLRGKINSQRDTDPGRMNELYENDELGRNTPKAFVGSSYLYIRSYPRDTGIRPGVDTSYASPDIIVRQTDGSHASSKLGWTLEPGKTYQLSCVVRNAGDLNVPSAKVEFYYLDKALGFDTRNAQLLGVASAWIRPFGRATVTLNYTVPKKITWEGFQGWHHFAFMVRVFSFSPLDIPVEDYSLNPRIDRHIAGISFVVLKQSKRDPFYYPMRVAHLPQGEERITITPVTKSAFNAMHHPIASEYKYVENRRLKKYLKAPELELKNKKHQLFRRKNSFTFKSSDRSGLSIKEQKGIYKKLDRALKNETKNRNTDPREINYIFKAYRAMRAKTVNTDFSLTIPYLGLRKREITAFDIINFDKISNKVKGSVRVFITR
jgi:hypothetical protein